MDIRPVFYDPSGRRRRFTRIGIVAFVALVLLAAGALFGSILNIGKRPPLAFAIERPSLEPGQLGLTARAGVRLGKRAFSSASWLISGIPAGGKPLAVSFYAPWDAASQASLARHVNDLDWLVPHWISVTGRDHHFTFYPDALDKDDARARQIIATARHRPKILPMVQNALNMKWDGDGTAALMADRAARATLLARLERFLVASRAAGAVFDFENLPPAAQRDYLSFLAQARPLFDRHHWLLTLTVPVADEGWNLKSYAAIADRIFLMAYDEHYLGGPPGPIASQPWFAATLGRALAGLPRDRVVVVVGSYSYDWTLGGGSDPGSVEDAMLTAHDSGVMPRFDQASGNLTFDYDEANDRHKVWLLDAASASNQMAALRQAGVQAFGLWRLGTEDPSIWQIFGRSHVATSGARGVLQPDVRRIEHMPAGTNVDIEGNGEILHIQSTPVQGLRALTVDPFGFVTNQRFIQLPLPYAIGRRGALPGAVALTFDDGPDVQWTPKILDILKAKHVPATFFFVGDMALTHFNLLRREVAEGHEVGNHTYTHPNLGQTSDTETRLEINANQRLFQAFTGRSMRLFRAPFLGDASPDTADEIVPALVAQNLGYLSVGLHVDPSDWKRPGVAHIVDTTISAVKAGTQDCATHEDCSSGNIILLHDAGGDRSQTVAALPMIIDRLRAAGYHFVPVSTLAGLSRDQAMPVLSGTDRAVATADFALFTLIGACMILLGWLFIVAITLGITRALLLSGLALWQAWREAQEQTPAIVPDLFVSVLIPAYNEAPVIAASVARVLASQDVRLEVIVIDDGSADGTGDIVEAAYGKHPKVRLMRLVNGGKARALNHGLTLAKGDIVIALDADTQFESTTIARLARWFAAPGAERLGAVAGNAKVGNRVNLVTAWQALEYITAQNLERRALGRLDAMTVVPGAVGAWRAAAIQQAGGYPADTLAEDQDLTIAIQRLGWTVRYDQEAIAWTEAPESFAALARQRFRWAFGTLQCLWKHRRILVSGKPPGLARIGLPQALLFQVAFAAISPVIDLALVVSLIFTGLNIAEHGWAQTQGDLANMFTYWAAFTAIDLLAGVVAFALEARERWRLLWLLVPQRIGYRQIMYYVVIKALASAARGRMVGWGKLERSGRVAAA